MLRKHSKHTYTRFKMIQMRAEANQSWHQVLNPMPMSYGGANSNLCCLGDDIKYEGVHDDFQPMCLEDCFRKPLI